MVNRYVILLFIKAEKLLNFKSIESIAAQLKLEDLLLMEPFDINKPDAPIPKLNIHLNIDNSDDERCTFEFLKKFFQKPCGKELKVFSNTFTTQYIHKLPWTSFKQLSPLLKVAKMTKIAIKIVHKCNEELYELISNNEKRDEFVEDFREWFEKKIVVLK